MDSGEALDKRVLSTIISIRRRSSYAFSVLLIGVIIVGVLFSVTMFLSFEVGIAEDSGVTQELIDAKELMIGAYAVSALVFAIIVLVIVTNMLKKIKAETTSIQDDLTIRSFGNAVLEPISWRIDTEKTNGEKIFELAKRILPSLYDSNMEYDGEKEIGDGYKLDCYQESPKLRWMEQNWNIQDVIIGKHFGDELVTIEKVGEFMDASLTTISSISKNKSIRIFLVGRNYDDFRELQAYEGEPTLVHAMNALKAIKNANDVLHDIPTKPINVYLLKENPGKHNESFFEIIWLDSPPYS